MSENKKLELLDQYDDVTFALLMDEYAEEEGARLRKEFEEAQAAGEVSDTSDALDEKCLQMIHRDFAKKRGKDNVRKFIRMTSKVAVAVMVFLGIASTVFFSVEAFRIPVLNFILNTYEEYTSVYFGDKVVAETNADPLEALLPDDYIQSYYRMDEDNLIYSYYENSNGDAVQFTMSYAIGEKKYDTEEADTTELVIGEYEAILIKKDGYRLIWVDPFNEIIYTFSATNLEKSSIINICNELADIYSEVFK